MHQRTHAWHVRHYERPCCTFRPCLFVNTRQISIRLGEYGLEIDHRDSRNSILPMPTLGWHGSGNYNQSSGDDVSTCTCCKSTVYRTIGTRSLYQVRDGLVTLIGLRGCPRCTLSVYLLLNAMLRRRRSFHRGLLGSRSRATTSLGHVHTLSKHPCSGRAGGGLFRITLLSIVAELDDLY